jgi:hypothetical protein
MKVTGKLNIFVYPNMLQESAYSPESTGVHHLISTSSMAERTLLQIRQSKSTDLLCQNHSITKKGVR